MLASLLLWVAGRRHWLIPPNRTLKVSLAQQGVTLRRRASRPDRLAAALVVLARTNIGAGQPVRAEAAAREALTSINDAAPRREQRHSHAQTWAMGHWALGEALRMQHRRAEALPAAEAAVTTCRSLASSDRRLRFWLTRALVTQAHLLLELGRTAEAMPTLEESMSTYDSLGLWQQTVLTHEASCAASDLAREFIREERYAQALAAADKATEVVEIYARLAPRKGLPMLAVARCQAGLAYHHLAQPEKAIDTVSQAVAAYRRLGAARRSELVQALGVLSFVLRHQGLSADACRVQDEIVATYRVLAHQDPAGHRGSLLDAVEEQVEQQWAGDAREESLRGSREIVALLREMAQDDPSYRWRLGEALVVLGARTDIVLDDATTALVFVDEGIAVARQLDVGVQRGHLLAEALYRRAWINLERDAAAGLQDIGEAMSHFRAAEGRHADVAKALGTKLLLLRNLDRTQDALDAGREQVRILRGLEPTASSAGLVEPLRRVAEAHSDLHKHDRAVVAMTESVGLRRTLLNDDPSTHQPALAQSLRRRAHDLAAINRFEDARRDLLEALSIFRRLAPTDSGAYQELIDLTQEQLDYLQRRETAEADEPEAPAARRRSNAPPTPDGLAWS